MTNIIVRPDAKSRISLGEIARNVSSYRMTVQENGQIILDPYVEIPLSDKWIFEDRDLLQKFKEQQSSGISKENQE